MNAPTTRDHLRRSLQEGLRAGARTALWLLSLMIPISLCTSLLAWSGALTYLTRFIGPAFPLLGLPREAALPFLGGALVNCYTGIAAMGSLTLSARQVTILGLMILIAHNLIVETSVQRRAGSVGWKILLLRLLTSAAAGFTVNLVLPASKGGAAISASSAAPVGLAGALGLWLRSASLLTAKIVILVTGLMIVQRLIQEFGLVDFLARILAPALRVLGVPRPAAFLWVVANTLGLAYGAAIILDDIRRGALDRREAELLNRSIAICHSLLEDTLLFVAVGASAFWITAPRLLLAALAVWSYRGRERLTAHRRTGA